MLGFYQFLIWFFTIVSLIALVYGVLEANITYIGMFFGSLIVSVVFYRLGENSPKEKIETGEIKDFSLEGIDKENTEILTAIESLKQEQVKLLTEFKSKVYSNEELLDPKQIKTQIIKDFIDTLSIEYELTTKQELQDLLSSLFSDLERKNINFLFDSNFFPSDLKVYKDWVMKSLILLGWNLCSTDDSTGNFFSGVFQRSGLLIGVTISNDLRLENLNIKQHEHFINNGSIDLSVLISPKMLDGAGNSLSENSKIVSFSHIDLPKLSSKIQKLL